MSRPLLALLVFAVLSPGCVPVTEPLGDIEKAEPDKALVGKWQRDGVKNGETLVIDSPMVKDNPKGLMRVQTLRRRPGDDHEPVWFHCTTIGKHTFATIYFGGPSNECNSLYADFSKEGAFGKYAKSTARRYFVIKYTLDGDGLVLDSGEEDAFKTLMKGTKFETENGVWYKTPTGWLAKYLEKNGPDKVYGKSDEFKYRRMKQ